MVVQEKKENYSNRDVINACTNDSESSELT